jgi:hypothetical protein
MLEVGYTPVSQNEGDWRIGRAMIGMLRIYSKAFLEEVTIQGLTFWFK